jgi:CheY-like chemotaxis protein
LEWLGSCFVALTKVPSSVRIRCTSGKTGPQPIATGERAPKWIKEWTEVKKRVQSYKILIADDEPEVVDLVRMMLEWEGYTVLAAVDGIETLVSTRTQRPDLILLDVRMPKMTGLAVLEKLHEDPETADIPVIMLSVVTGYPEVRAALQRGAVAYLPKPFEMREMVHLVERVLATDPAGRESLRQQALNNLVRP